MEKKVIKCLLEVEPKEFTNKENGEIIKYNAVTAIIDNVRINLSVKQDCKQLFNYVLSKIQ